MRAQFQNIVILGISLFLRTISFVDAVPCAQLIVSGCVGTSIEDDITGVFQPYDGSCSDADTSRSMYMRRTASKDVYLFFHLGRDRWYFDAAGYNSCGENYKQQLSTEFEGGVEPWMDISWNGFPGEADCYDGLDDDNKFSFSREPISITCNSNGGGSDETLGNGNPGSGSPNGGSSGAISTNKNGSVFLVGAASVFALLMIG